jgi:WD40 repeat protein
VFSHDGRSIVTASRNGIVRVWDAASGDLNADLNGHLGLAGVTSVAFSADDAQILTASNDGTARLWDLRPQASRRMLALDMRVPVRSAMFIRDGREVLTVEQDATVRLWDAENGRILGSSRDGRLILTALSSGTWAVSDSVTGARIGVLKLSDGPRVWPRLMTEPNDNAAQLWDPKWGLPPLINRVAFAVSHDRKRIVMGSADEKAVVRSLETGEHVATLSGHEHSIYDVAFSPDGTRIVTAAADRTARIWDATSGQTVAVLEGHKSDVWSASFSPDGGRVVTASQDGTARIWKVFPTTQALVDHAKAVVPRCLRREQRLAAFLPPTPPAWCVEAKKWPDQTRG